MKILAALWIACSLYGAAPTVTELRPRGAQKGRPFKLTLVGTNLGEGVAILSTLPATFTPIGSATIPRFFSAENEVKRQAVNAWIRTSGAFDAVIDFDAVVRDPADPVRLLPAYNSGDGVHPNDAGYEAMANSIDLGIFR